jgi:hypothetical protein
MSDIALVADAVAVAQVRSQTITAYDVATTYRCTINGRVVSTLGTGGTVTTTAAALVVLLNASTYPEFAEITWSNVAGAVIGTCDTAGKSITFALTVSGGTGTVGAASDTTSNDGPEALTANNCKNASTSARALPVASDTFTLEAIDTDLKYNLDALSAVTVAALYIEASFTGQLGNPPVNADGDTSYDEYRAQYLLLGATVCLIGDGDGDGSDLMMIDLSSILSGVTVLKTGSSPVIDGLGALIIKGTNASNTLKAVSGSIDIAPFAGETATFATLTAIGDATVRTSIGTTLTTVNAGGSATIDISAAGTVTTINVYDQATVIVRGSMGATTINVYGANATIIWLSSGNPATVNLYDGAKFDCTENPSTFTITTLTGSGTPTVSDPNSRMTVTNAVDPKQGNIFGWTWDLKPGRQFTLGAP